MCHRRSGQHRYVFLKVLIVLCICESVLSNVTDLVDITGIDLRRLTKKPDKKPTPSRPNLTKHCPAEEQREHIGSESITIKWPEATGNLSRLASSPLCLDNNRYLVTRTCNAQGQWEPSTAPMCSHTQPNFQNDECPDGFEWYKPIESQAPLCLRLTSPESWSFFNSTNLLETRTIADIPQVYQSYLLSWLRQRNKGRRIWMPARILWGDGILRWMVPIRFGERVSQLIVINGGIKDQCLLVDIGSNAYIGSNANCNAFHLSLYIYYDGGDSLMTRHCPSGWYASRLLMQAQQCYNIAKTSEPYTDTMPQSFCKNSRDTFLMNNPQRSHVYQEIAHSFISDDHRCVFNPHSLWHYPFTSQTWETISHDISFVNWDNNWSETLTNNEMLMLKGATGRWVFSSHYTCVACQFRSYAFRSTPLLNLHFVPDDNVLILSIENEQSLWGSTNVYPEIKCFVQRSDDLTFMDVPFSQQTRSCDYCSDIIKNTNYEIRMTPKHYRGEYWCYGFDIRRSEHIATDPVTAYHTVYETFAVLVNSSNCLTRCSQLYLENLFETFIKRKHEYSGVLIIPKVKLMRRTFVGNHQQLLFHLKVALHDAYEPMEVNNLNMYDPDMLRVYHIFQMLGKLLPELNGLSIYEFVSVTSTKFCVPPSISTLQKLNWWAIPIGNMSPSLEQYVCGMGMGAIRGCTGNRVDGGVWVIFDALEKDCVPVSEETERFIHLSKCFTGVEQTPEVLSNLTQLLKLKPQNRLPIDMFYVSSIMARAAHLKSSSIPVEINRFFEIYNEIMAINDTILRISSLGNTTNRLLESWEYLSHDMSAVVLSSNGVRLIRTPMLIMAIIDTTIENITGIGLFTSNATDRDNLNEYIVRPLQPFQNPRELLIDNDLEIAAYLPSTLLLRLQEQHGPIHKLVMTIFNNDNLFQAIRNTDGIRPRADGLIVSITMPDLDTHNLPVPVSVFFRTSSVGHTQSDACNFWNYTLPGGWSPNGMRQTANVGRNVQCTATHLTHFGHLFFQTIEFTAENERALDIITIVGCSLSLLGITGIFVTGFTFPQWRTKVSTKFLMQFSAAIALQIILFGLVQTELKLFDQTEQYLGCIAIGAMQHYALLVVFLWKLIIAYMQFMRYVVVFSAIGTNQWLLKASILGWCVPVLPVAVTLLVDPYLYVPNLSISTTHMCYPRGYALYFGLLLPIAIVIVANLVVFVTVLWSLLCPAKVVAEHRASAAGSSDRKITLAQLRLSVFLFFLLGLTWFFGFLAAASKMGIMFSYLFCITATIHGFILFVYFVILDPVARNLWLTFFRRWNCLRNKSYVLKSQQ